jgi:predicted secreted protein
LIAPQFVVLGIQADTIKNEKVTADPVDSDHRSRGRRRLLRLATILGA